MPKLPITIPIAGHRYYPEGRKLVPHLAQGTPLRLVREPTNEFDALAVKVLDGDTMLGFVPRSHNVEVAWAMDGGRRLTAVFAGCQEEGQPVIQIVWP
jgi:hypothetical protein